MERNDIGARIQAIGTCEDDAERRSLLTSLQQELETDYDTRDNLQNQVNTLTERNNTLTRTNYDLFLQVTDQSKKVTEPNRKDKPEEKELKYENLFDENGGLK